MNLGTQVALATSKFYSELWLLAEGSVHPSSPKVKADAYQISPDTNQSLSKGSRFPVGAASLTPHATHVQVTRNLRVSSPPPLLLRSTAEQYYSILGLWGVALIKVRSTDPYAKV